MGIKIVCPNGHKLNVKSFLAGKRGVCPQCGSKFDIPADAEEESPAVDSLAGVASTPAAAGNSAASAPQSADVAPAPVAASTPIRSVQPSPAPQAPERADPLAEAPEASWYVRPPSGGQYGPAKAQIMRQWINEGRVTPDSLVWREGWPDWKLASETFPNLPGTGPPSVNPPSAIAGAAPVVSAVRPAGAVSGAQSTAVAPVQPAKSSAAGPLLNIVTDEPTGRRGKRPSRRDKTSVRLTALVILFVVLVVLAVVLVLVLK